MDEMIEWMCGCNHERQLGRPREIPLLGDSEGSRARKEAGWGQRIRRAPRQVSRRWTDMSAAKEQEPTGHCENTPPRG